VGGAAEDPETGVGVAADKYGTRLATPYHIDLSAPSATAVTIVGSIARESASRFPGSQSQLHKGYDVVLEQYPCNPKAPAAQLRKGEALMATGQKDAGVRELRSLIQRYPQTPEAQQARSRLNAIGAKITPGKPSAYQR
jgi:hypothetical protein